MKKSLKDVPLNPENFIKMLTLINEGKISGKIGKTILEDFELTDGGSPEVLTYNLPHRGYMATPDIVSVATLSDEDIKALEQFYVQKDRKSFIRFDFDLDVKVLRPELVSVAY